MEKKEKFIDLLISSEGNDNKNKLKDKLITLLTPVEDYFPQVVIGLILAFDDSEINNKEFANMIIKLIQKANKF